MQADRKIAGSDSNVPIRFTVTAVKRSHKGRLWIEDPSEVCVCVCDCRACSSRVTVVVVVVVVVAFVTHRHSLILSRTLVDRHSR